MDAAFFHPYGIGRDDVDYIMNTSPIVRRKDEAGQGTYRRKDVILEVYDATAAAAKSADAHEAKRTHRRLISGARTNMTHARRKPDPSTLPALAFFPWLHLDRDYRIGSLDLLAFDRQCGRDDLTAEEAEAVRRTVDAYVDFEGTPVAAVTLVRRRGRDLLASWSDAERAELFELREVVTVAGLSRRRFFHRRGYWNADHFQLVVQLSPGTNGITVVTRRREGETTSYWPEGQFQRPAHVQEDIIPVSLDERLAKGLVAAMDRDDGDRFLDAVSSFNLANTDSDQILPQTEMVHLVAALQRVLGCGANVRGVINAIKNHVPGLVRRAPSVSGKFVAPGVRELLQETVTETWIRDLQRLRGPMAHGHRSPKGPRIWQPHEHLLLGNVAFLMVLKTVLSNLGLYAFTSDDELEIDVFEHLAAEELFGGPKGAGPEKRPWNAIRTEAMWTRTRRRAEEYLCELGEAHAEKDAGR